jgi:hypothetical protein
MHRDGIFIVSSLAKRLWNRYTERTRFYLLSAQNLRLNPLENTFGPDPIVTRTASPSDFSI